MTRTWLLRILRGTGAALLLGAVLGGLEADLVLRTSTTQMLNALERLQLWAYGAALAGGFGALLGALGSAGFGALRGFDPDSRTLFHDTGRDPRHPWLPWPLGLVAAVLVFLLVLPHAASARGTGTAGLLAALLAAPAGVGTALGAFFWLRRTDFTGKGQALNILGLPTALMVTMSLGVSAPQAGGKGGLNRAREGLPNVLLVTVDALRADHVGPGSRVRTPALDWLSRNGASFAQAVTPSAAEGPAASALLTGGHPLATGFLADGRRLPTRVPGSGKELSTLAELFDREGYSTAAFVSSAALDGRASGLDRGFQVYDDGIGEGLRGSGRLALPTLRRWIGRGDGQAPSARTLLRPSTETIVRLGDWLNYHYRENVFVWLDLADPRTPFIRSDLAPEALLDPIPGDAGRAYGGRVAQLDQVLEELFETLDRDGLMAWTLVVVAGRRGWAAGGEPPHAGESWARVPFLLHGPGIPKGAVVEDQVSLVDLPATLLSAAGLKRARLADGRNLLPLVDGRELEPQPAIVVGTPRGDGQCSVALRTPALKLVRDSKGTEALYDLRVDPREIDDAREKHPDEAARFAQALNETLGRKNPVAVVPPLDPGRAAALRGLEAAR